MLIEQEYFQFISEGVNPIADGADRIYYTEARDYFDDRVFRNFSIKIPLQGNVFYETGNNKFTISPGNYLLTHAQPGKMIIESAFLTRCVCIDISKNTLAQAITLLEAGGKIPCEHIDAGYFFSPDFFENVYPIRDNDLGIILSSLVGNLVNNHISISVNTFQNLAREIVLHAFNNLQYLEGLKARRQETKKDLLARLWRARFFIDEHFLRNPPIPEIAAHCNISGFYFFRSFKQAFTVTPYEYVMSKRLAHAQKLLLTNTSLTTIAGICGFPDVFTFSKAFKKANGLSPSKFRLSYNSKVG